MNQLQLQRLGELNVELFTCVIRELSSIDEYCRKYNISIPDDPKIDYLARQALFLICEINGKTTRSDGFFHREDPDGDFPKPMKDGFKYHIWFC